jgi:hypothetical protein
VTSKITEFVRERVASTPGLIGLLLVGSAARGEMQKNSDWDFVAVISDDVPWPKPFRDGGRETFAAADGRQVEVAYRTAGSLRRRMAEQAVLGFKPFAEMLAEGLPVGEVSDTVRALQSDAREVLSKAPDPLPASELAWRCYEIWNQLKDVGDCLDDPLTSFYLSQLAFGNMVTLFIRLSGDWLPRPKAVFGQVEQLDSEFHGMCGRFAAAASPHGRYEVLCAIMEYLAQCFGLTFDAYYMSPAEERSAPPPPAL